MQAIDTPRSRSFDIRHDSDALRDMVAQTGSRWRAKSMSFATRFESLAAALLLALVASAMSAGQACAEEIRLDALKIPAVISGSNGPATSNWKPSCCGRTTGCRIRSPCSIMDRREVPTPAPPCRLMACGRRRSRLRGAAGSPSLSCAAAMAVPRADGSRIMAPAPIRITQRPGEPRRAISPPSPNSWPPSPMSARASGSASASRPAAFATVALTADAPPDLAAAISFAPGRGSSGPDTVCGEKQLVSAFAQYGKTSRMPLLWVSAENDHFFGPQLVAQLTAAFSNAGGNVTFVKTPPFGSDGHQLFERRQRHSDLVADRRPVSGVEQSRAARQVDRRSVAGCAAAIQPQRRGREAFADLSRQRTQQGFCGRQRFAFRLGHRPPDGRCRRVKDALGFCVARGQMHDRQRQQQAGRINSSSAGWR